MKWISMLSMGVAWFGTIGCGPAEEAPSCPDPTSGEVDEACGVWVSASLGDDGNPGTRDAPMASLAAAATAAFYKEGNVYACGELWTEPMILPADVSLFGGFDCANGWVYGGKPHRARLETGPGQIPITTSGFGATMKIADMNIRADDADVPGGSSIAVMVADVHNITFERCTIKAGDAKDGLDATELEGPALAGAAGNAGAEACTAVDGLGGTAPEVECSPGAVTQGGKGGDGGATVAMDGEAGMPAPSGEKDPNNPVDGDGGQGQVGAEGCTPGEPGANGADGMWAPSVADRGFISPEGFTPPDSPDGMPGKPGQGGGGGGGSRGGAAACGAAAPGGAGGGAGGNGGCGGAGGKGGKGGGSSIAIVMIGDGGVLWFQSCDVWVGKAGDGGEGAMGQPGGAGGEGGPGGAGQGAAQAGCSGGKGGAGGKGGTGAGGNGGHAVHVVYRWVGTTQPYPDTTFQGNTYGGKGGSGGPTGDDGLDGRGNMGSYQTAIMNFQQ